MRPHISIPIFLGLSAAFVSASAENPDFITEVQPILERNCVRCHNADKTKGGLRMDTHPLIMEGGDTADAIVPGDPLASEMLVRIHLRPIDEGVMPDEGRALEFSEVAILDAWVKAGAPWPEGVTLTEKKPDPIKRVSLPAKAPTSPQEAAEMVDDIIRRENVDEDVITSTVVGDAAFLRRTTIDLIGRIPTMEEIREYESWSDDRREKLVVKLLEHPRFADRWTVFFADMLRVRSNIPGGNQLLAYLNGSIREGKPYDELVRELIAASGRANSNPAVGFILGDDAMPMELAAATSQIFLGVRMGCAMCHDHPFDDWQQKEFYDFAAFFGKTKKVENRDRGLVYATEGDKMTVMWPPEDKAGEDGRDAVRPRFPFKLAKHPETPEYISRFEAKRKQQEQAAASGNKDDSLDALLDAVEPSVGRPKDMVLEEAKKESKLLDVHGDIYRASELRGKLADLITSPQNDFFARALVNRVWAELIGHGFVEPLDNFSPYVDLNHASTLDFLAQEFVASGYDFRSLVRMIALTDTYSRSQLDAKVPITIREASEKHFAAAPVRRMLGEVLYDSIVVAGHLEDFKWPKGANRKEIIREIRVPTGEYQMVEAGDMPMMNSMPASKRGDGYDLESSLQLDFEKLAKADELAEITAMKNKSDEQIKAEEMATMQKEARNRVMKYTMEKVSETVDDNPKFDSAMRMASPAPPAHFLRVFGQPDRIGLGEFRDPSSSLRQQLMMLNGRMTHEASRVGPMEPISKVLEKDASKAIEYAYQEILTRHPSESELNEARTILGDNPKEGIADLRWALLNSNEFRFQP